MQGTDDKNKFKNTSIFCGKNIVCIVADPKVGKRMAVFVYTYDTVLKHIKRTMVF